MKCVLTNYVREQKYKTSCGHWLKYMIGRDLEENWHRDKKKKCPKCKREISITYTSY